PQLAKLYRGRRILVSRRWIVSPINSASHRSRSSSVTSISRSRGSSGAIFCQLLACARQADAQTAAVLGISAGLGQAACGQTIDDALDGGDVHRGQTSQLVLRAWPGLGEFRQRSPLG